MGALHHELLFFAIPAALFIWIASVRRSKFFSVFQSPVMVRMASITLSVVLLLYFTVLSFAAFRDTLTTGEYTAPVVAQYGNRAYTFDAHINFYGSIEIVAVYFPNGDVDYFELSDVEFDTPINTSDSGSNISSITLPLSSRQVMIDSKPHSVIDWLFGGFSFWGLLAFALRGYICWRCLIVIWDCSVWLMTKKDLNRRKKELENELYHAAQQELTVPYKRSKNK